MTFAIVWDMETNDPDDFLTLLFLAGHPQITLKAVTVLPGSPQQIGLIRHALGHWFGLEIPIGARNLNSPKSHVSDWHYAAYGNIPTSHEALPAADVLLLACDSDTILLTGAALSNIAAAIRQNQGFATKKIVIQGGFAGEGVVPSELQMEKFRGRATSPTHNLMGDKKAAEQTLSHAGFEEKYLVSKNVCHRVIYDRGMHQLFANLRACSQAHNLIWQGMEVYLQMNPNGKMLHDILAACCAIDPSVCTWAEVEIYRQGGEWGAKLSPNSGTWITIDYDHAKFIEMLTNWS